MIYLLKPDGQAFKALMTDLAQLNPDLVWSVEITKGDKKRSLQQNAYYWKLLTIIGEHFGYTKDEMHDELSSRWLGWEDKKTIGGRVITRPISTTSLNTKQFAEYLDKIVALAMSHDITIPRPERYGYDF